MRWTLIIAALALSGCATTPGVTLASGSSLVSGTSPAATDSHNSEPQSANSLPLGAAGLQSSGVNGTHPNYFNTTITAF